MPLVLMYHFFGDVPATGDPKGLFVSRDALIEQLSWLRRRGWQPLSLDQYLSALGGASTPRRSYLLTIDDGHHSALRIAAPVLAAAGVPSVLFVPSGLMGGTASWTPEYENERLLTMDELKDVERFGMEIGVHGFDHTRMQALDAGALTQHTSTARDVLTDAGHAGRSFAYPYGTWDTASREAVAVAGYSAAFAVAREGGRFAIDRVGIFRGDSLTSFRLKLSLPYRLVSRVAGRAWRLRHLIRDARLSVLCTSGSGGGRGAGD